MKRTSFSVILLLAAAFALPAFGHGIVDQQFSGPFDHDFGVNSGSDTQGFTPTVSSLSGVDIFLVGNGSAPSLPITVNIRDAANNIVGSATVLTPAGLTGDTSNPYVLHVDFTVALSLTPGNQYLIQLDPDGGFYGWAASFGDPYPGGYASQDGIAFTDRDLGFRTYSAAPEPSGPTTKSDCKNGGWATFTSPRSFKNQGDCIQFVNTGK